MLTSIRQHVFYIGKEKFIRILTAIPVAKRVAVNNGKRGKKGMRGQKVSKASNVLLLRKWNVTCRLLSCDFSDVIMVSEDTY